MTVIDLALDAIRSGDMATVRALAPEIQDYAKAGMSRQQARIREIEQAIAEDNDQLVRLGFVD